MGAYHAWVKFCDAKKQANSTAAGAEAAAAAAAVAAVSDRRTRVLLAVAFGALAVALVASALARRRV